MIFTTEQCPTAPSKYDAKSATAETIRNEFCVHNKVSVLHDFWILMILKVAFAILIIVPLTSTVQRTARTLCTAVVCAGVKNFLGARIPSSFTV